MDHFLKKRLSSTGRTIGDEGAGRLAEVLKTNTTLTRLDLSCNMPRQN